MDAPRILIVEDDAILAAHLQDTLCQFGYLVAGLTATGEAAVASALKERPDAILMDIRLRGDMTGIQAANEIHKTADIPVVYLTAYTDEMLLQQAKLTDAYAYLAKPVRDRELRASLEMSLYKHAAEQRLQHLNQVLRAVRDVNQLITREHDAQRLLQQACTILMRTRGYVSVWIGQLDGTRPHALAYSGAGNEFLESIAADANQEQIQELPFVIAIHTQRAVICHDLFAEKGYAPWREKAATMQFHSSAAIPLESAGRPFGVLCVFADHTNVFDDEEMGLLGELAGDVAFGLKTLEDEIARLWAEQALAQREQHLRTILQTALDGYWIVSPEGRFLDVNDAYCAMSGYSREEFLQMSIPDVDASETPAEAAAHLRRIREQGSDRFDTRHRRKDGGMIDVEVSVRHIDLYGGQLVCFCRDVTAEKQAEEALRQSEEKYRNIFENAVEGIYQSSPQGRFLSVNSSMAHMFGYPSPEQMIANITSIEDQFFADPGHRAAFIEHVEETGKIENAETECLRQDGSRIWISASARAVKDADGNLMHYEGFFHDVTARRRSEEELERRAAHQAALNAVIGAVTQGSTNLQALLELGLEQVLSALRLKLGAVWLTPVAGVEQPLAVQGLPAQVATVLADIPSTEPMSRDHVVAIVDWDSVSGPLAQVMHPAGVRAWLISPLSAEGKPIGGLAVGSSEAHRWSDEEVALVQAVGRQLGSAAERARLFEETQRRAQQLALLYDAGLALNGVLDSRVLLEFLFKTAMKATHADGVEFSRYDPASNELRFEMAVGLSQSAERAARERPVFTLDDEEELICRVAKNRTTLNVPDMTVAHSIAANTETRSGLWLPLVHGENLLGVLGVLSSRPNAFMLQDERLLTLFANQAAIAMENARLFEAEQSRRSELATLYDLSRSLADAGEFSAALNLIVHRAVEIVRVTFARIALVDGDDLVIRAAYPARVLDRDLLSGGREAMATQPHCRHVLEQNEPIVLHLEDTGITAEERDKLFLGVAKTLALVPLCADEHRLGLLMLGEARSQDREPFDEDRIRKARNVSDEAANALRRMGLREETEKRLAQVQALHAIDSAIMSSTDLRVSLHIILGHVVEQLAIHAADVLLFDPLTSTLSYAAGRGFHSSVIEESRLRLGEGMAGRAALERRTIHLREIVKEDNALKRSRWIVKEGFVTYYGVPLVAKGKLKGVLEVFHRAPFDGDDEWMHVLETLATQTTVAIDSAQLLERLDRSNTELQLAYDSTIEGWSRALDLRDRETEGHTQRVTEIAVLLGREMGIGESELVHLRRGALLHDIGKMGVPDHILLKQGPLTEEEWTLMRQHPALAFGLLSSITYLRPALDVPYCHHEKWDGTGYPRGLNGELIPLLARVFAIVDVWDALRSKRPYREAWPETKVRAYLQECSGKHFDPKVVRAFSTLLGTLDSEMEPDADPKSGTTG